MDGLLILDKPAGPTSHDVVARMRRTLREKRIGHTGTLDPAATGVLALVLGRATRLAQFLSSSDKSYEAVVRVGFATDTADAQGRPTGPASAATMPSREAIDAALDAFRGTFLQQPPAFSAKKIDGKRSHKLARARVRASATLSGSQESESKGGASDAAGDARLKPSRSLPIPVSVTAHAITIVSVVGDTVMLRVDCSAGFYIRSLAHDLGERLGVGAHLASLRRTRIGDFTVGQALALDVAEREPRRAAAAVIGLADMLPGLPAFSLTADGVRRAMNGCDLGPRDSVDGETLMPNPQSLIRLLDPGGALVSIGRVRPANPESQIPNPWSLHPVVVLM